MTKLKNRETLSFLTHLLQKSSVPVVHVVPTHHDYVASPSGEISNSLPHAPHTSIALVLLWRMSDYLVEIEQNRNFIILILLIL